MRHRRPPLLSIACFVVLAMFRECTRNCIDSKSVLIGCVHCLRIHSGLAVLVLEVERLQHKVGLTHHEVISLFILLERREAQICWLHPISQRLQTSAAAAADLQLDLLRLRTTSSSGCFITTDTD